MKMQYWVIGLALVFIGGCEKEIKLEPTPAPSVVPYVMPSQTAPFDYHHDDKGNNN